MGELSPLNTSRGDLLGGSYLRRGKSQTPVILDSLSSSGQNTSRVCDLKEGRSHPTVYVPTKLVKKRVEAALVSFLEDWRSE